VGDIEARGLGMPILIDSSAGLLAGPYRHAVTVNNQKAMPGSSTGLAFMLREHQAK
jgi:hypothetical protein